MADRNERNNSNNSKKTYFDIESSINNNVTTIIPDLNNVIINNKEFNNLVDTTMATSVGGINSNVISRIDSILTSDDCGYTADEISKKSLTEKLKMLTAKMKLMEPGPKGAIKEAVTGVGVSKKNIESLMYKDIEKIFREQDGLIKSNNEILQAFSKQLLQDNTKKEQAEIEAEGYSAQLAVLKEEVNKAEERFNKLDTKDISSLSPREIAQHNKEVAAASSQINGLIKDIGDVSQKKSSTDKAIGVLEQRTIENKAKYKKISVANLSLMGSVEEKRKEVYEKFADMQLVRPNIESNYNAQPNENIQDNLNNSANKAEVSDNSVESQEVVGNVTNTVQSEILDKPIEQRAEELANRFATMSQDELALWTRGYGYESIEAALDYMNDRDKEKVRNILGKELEVSGDTVNDINFICKDSKMSKLNKNIIDAIRDNNFSKLEYNDYITLEKFVAEYNSKKNKMDPKVLKEFDKNVMDRISRAAIMSKCLKDVGIKEKAKGFFGRFLADVRKKEDAEQLFMNTLSSHNKEKADRWRSEVELNNSVFGMLGLQYNGPAEAAEAESIRNKTFAKKTEQRDSAVR